MDGGVESGVLLGNTKKEEVNNEEVKVMARPLHSRSEHLFRLYLVYKLANFDLLPDYAKPIFFFLVSLNLPLPPFTTKRMTAIDPLRRSP